MDLSDDFYRTLLNNFYDGVYFVNKDREITYWNKGAERITGYPSFFVMGKRCMDNILEHVNDEGVLLCTDLCPLVRSMSSGETIESEVFLKHAKGHRVPVLVRISPITNDRGEIVGAVEIFSDNSMLIGTRRKLQKVITESMTDHLTGLANRRLVEIRAIGALAEFQNHGINHGLLFGDIDHFKAINDTYGHNAGDEVLKTVSRTIRANLRGADIAGRWGGEEFAIILYDVRPESLGAVAEKIRCLIEKSSIELDGSVVRVTMSFGASIAEEGDTVETWFGKTDELLYRSKHEGRNRVTVMAQNK